jgi:hypothetical protein
LGGFAKSCEGFLKFTIFKLCYGKIILLAGVLFALAGVALVLAKRGN